MHADILVDSNSVMYLLDRMSSLVETLQSISATGNMVEQYIV